MLSEGGGRGPSLTKVSTNTIDADASQYLLSHPSHNGDEKIRDSKANWWWFAIIWSSLDAELRRKSGFNRRKPSDNEGVVVVCVFLFLTRQTVSSIFLSVRLSVCSYLCLSVNFFLLFTWMHMMYINWIHAISTLFKLIFFLLKILDYFLISTSIWEGQKHILFYRLFAPWRYSDEICKFAHQGVKKLRDFTSLGMLLIISSRESILW